MKRTLLLIITFLIPGIELHLNAQSVRSIVVQPVPGVDLVHPQGTMTAQCGPDALNYVYSKVDTIGADSLFFFEMWTGDRTSTAYALNSSASVSNVFVLGRVTPGYPGPVTLEVSIWNVNSNWRPTTMIPGAVTTMSINAVPVAEYHLFTFANPVAVSDSFAVVVSNIDASDRFWVIGSDGDPADPALLEGLSAYDPGSGTFGPMSATYPGIGEGVLVPVLQYSTTSNFTVSAAAVCAGDAVTFTNTSSNLYGNRFFNQHAFSMHFLGEADSTFAWDFGDSSPVVWGANQTHTFTTPGVYTVTLSGEMAGYTDTCVDVKTMQITVAGPAASFAVDSSQEPAIGFQNTSTGSGVVTYFWDFGDGNTSAAQNPVHTYTSIGSYTVTLTVTDTCGTATTSQTVVITTVGVSENAGMSMNIVYHAGSGELNVSHPPSSGAVIEVYNLLGKVICSERAGNTTSTAINMQELPPGTYIVRVTSGMGAGTAKFVVMR